MEVNVMMVSLVGKIAKIGNIETTEGGHKVVSVTVPSKVGIQDTLEMRPIEVSFWDKDAEQLSKYPVGTPIFIREGALYIKPFIKEDGKADVSIVVSDYQWSIVGEPTPASAPKTNSKESTPPSLTPLPAILKEVMNAGKYKGKGMIYAEVLSQDRQYINDLILNEKTPEAWKVKLIEISKAYDNWLQKNQHG